jgi:hypothetical protein
LTERQPPLVAVQETGEEQLGPVTEHLRCARNKFCAIFPWWPVGLIASIGALFACCMQVLHANCNDRSGRMFTSTSYKRDVAMRPRPLNPGDKLSSRFLWLLPVLKLGMCASGTLIALCMLPGWQPTVATVATLKSRLHHLRQSAADDRCLLSDIINPFIAVTDRKRTPDASLTLPTQYHAFHHPALLRVLADP